MRNRLIAPLALICCLELGAQASLASLSPARDLSDYPPGFYDGDPLPAKTAYLTFDDGPSDFTREILDKLERESVRATFFLCARWAVENWLPRPSSLELHAKTLKRMYSLGHAVGNHSATHKNFAWISADGVRKELRDNQALLEWSIGLGYPPMTLVRPPFGSPWWRSEDTAAMARAAKALASRAVVVMWNDAADSCDSESYVDGEWYTREGTDRGTAEFRKKVDRIAQRVSKAADGRGIVVLMHDTHPTAVEALPRVIALLKQRGYSFATMEDWVKWRYGVSSAELIAAQEARLTLNRIPGGPATP